MSGAAETRPGGAKQRTSVPELAPTAQRAVWALVALLVAKRLAYHLMYIVGNPLALGTFSDGRRYELAARDLLAHPPLGSERFDLNGLYAYVLALPMTVAPEVVVGLVLQLVIAAGALFLFQRAARRVFGSLFGGLSLCVLLASPELAFYENKYLPVALAVATSVVALVAAIRCFDRLDARSVALAGAGAGLAVLGNPALALALPASYVAFIVLARSAGKSGRAMALAFSIGLILAIAPMVLRNQLVTGSPDLFSRRTLAIGLLVGHNPYADGRWNSAGGVFTSVAALESAALADKLGVTKKPAQRDAAIDRALLNRALSHIASDPPGFLDRTLDKLWSALGNQRFVRDYDLEGEKLLIGAYHQWGLPFGVILGLGVLGFGVLARRARAVRQERSRLLALLLVLGGQFGAVLTVNVLVFTSAEMRVPLLIPLAFVSGPALEALYDKLAAHIPSWTRLRARLEAGPILLIASALVCAQAFWPRTASIGRPSAAHYYNLGTVEERLDRLEQAAAHYADARELNPRQAMFFLAEGRVLRRLGRFEEAMKQLTHIIRMPNTPADVHAQAHAERMFAAAGMIESAPTLSTP